MSAQKYKSIILKPHEVVGILAGRQTQIRRILKPQPIGKWVFQDDDGTWFDYWDSLETDAHGAPLREETRPLRLSCAPSDIVFGKETWGHDWYDDGQTRAWKRWVYRADGNGAPMDNGDPMPWRPSVHMPQEAARIWLRIGEVKVQRVRDASEEDAKAEGVECLFNERECCTTVGLVGTRPEEYGYKNYLWHGHVGRTITQKQSDAWPYQFSDYPSARGSLRSLLASTASDVGWERNDWTVVYKIEAVDRPEDA